MALGAKTGVRPRWLLALTAIVVIVVLSGCTGGPGGAGIASEPAESVATSGPPPEAVTLAQLGASKISVRGAPDWMANDGTHLFVKTDSGSVSVIDPAKSREVQRLPLGAGGLCQGIGVGGDAVWSCDPNPDGNTDDVLLVNPKSGKGERFQVAKRPDQGPLDVAADRVWVITDAGLVELNLKTGRMRLSIWGCPEPISPLQISGRTC